MIKIISKHSIIAVYCFKLQTRAMIISYFYIHVFGLLFTNKITINILKHRCTETTALKQITITSQNCRREISSLEANVPSDPFNYSTDTYACTNVGLV